MERGLFTAGAIMVLMLAGCREKPAVVEVSETRPLTSADGMPKLDATSQERFRGAQAAQGPGPSSTVNYAFTTPDGWRQKPGTPNRLMNFSFGPEDAGEIYVSQTHGGDLMGNVARWRRQFGIEETSGEDLAGMSRVVMGAGEGLLVEARGTYSPGMGRPAAPGSAFLGVIAVLQGGGVFTVKMTGPEELVMAERAHFLEFCRTLKPAE